METYSDNALMIKVKEGDFDKMGLLYERYHRKLYGFIFHMTQQPQLSEDMVQNVFYRMLKYRSGFTGTGEFKAWMYHVARNAMYDHFRKVKRSPAISGLEGLDSKRDEQHTVHEAMEKAEEHKVLEKALQELSHENRELLVLCRYQDLKYEEIAQILNTTEGAIKVRVHRALNQLKEAFLKLDN